jgi:single-stranded-DNA-specific exonuclease
MEAGDLAQKLDNQNRERQAITREMQERAAGMAAEAGIEDIIFAFSAEFNSGVVGLAAARLVDAYYRPAVVGHMDNEFTRASCRSIPEFHITRALDDCRDLLVRHGGHAVAAGFTVRNENLAELQSRLAEIARRELADLELIPQLRYDAEVSLSDLQPMELLPYLDLLQPTGQENPEAVFFSPAVRVAQARTVGAESQHLKLRLSENGYTWDAIAFRQGHQLETLGGQVDLLYTVERNEYNGYVGLQLNVRDLRPAG